MTTAVKKSKSAHTTLLKSVAYYTKDKKKLETFNADRRKAQVHTELGGFALVAVEHFRTVPVSSTERSTVGKLSNIEWLWRWVRNVQAVPAIIILNLDF